MTLDFATAANICFGVDMKREPSEQEIDSHVNEIKRQCLDVSASELADIIENEGISSKPTNRQIYNGMHLLLTGQDDGSMLRNMLQRRIIDYHKEYIDGEEKRFIRNYAENSKAELDDMNNSIRQDRGEY